MDQGFWLVQAVFQSLQAWRALDLTSRRLYFWRDRSGREVDFVLENNGVLGALEIKAASQVAHAEIVSIKAFQQGLGADQWFRRGAVLHGGAARPLGENLYALPWGWLLPKVP